jgi:hypothetical protein
MTKSNRRYTQHNDHGGGGNYNARAQGSERVEPDGASDLNFNRRLRWNQGWHRVGHVSRRSRAECVHLEYRERIARRRDARWR